MTHTQKNGAANSAKFSAMTGAKVNTTFRAAVLMQIASASKAVQYLRETADTGFSDYLAALSTVRKYENQRCNDVGFLLNPEVPVNDAVKRLDVDNTGQINGANLLSAVKKYMGKNLTPKK